VTTSGGGSTLYLDGTEVASGSVPIYTPGNSAFYIGTTDNGNGSTSKMNGLIQDVAIFNTALSQSEIQALMASGISGSLPTNTAVTTAASGTLDLSGGSQQVASLTGAGTVINSSNMDAASVLTLRATGGSTTFSGTILGGGTLGTISLVMSGSGTQVLAGSLLGPGSVTVNAGTLILSGSDNYTGGTDVVGGTLIATNSQSLPGGTSLTVGTGGTFIFDPSASGSVVTNLAAAVAVPEPSTVVLLSVGAIGLLGRAWRRRKQFLRPKTESGGILRDLGVCVPFNTQSLSGLRL